jgi:hypothetical protein
MRCFFGKRGKNSFESHDPACHSSDNRAMNFSFAKLEIAPLSHDSFGGALILGVFGAMSC